MSKFLLDRNETETETIRILVADDHPVVREGLTAMLGTQTDLEVIGEAVDGPDVVRAALDLRPDVVILDLEMPRLDGVAVIRTVREQMREPKFVVFTAFDRDEQILSSVRAGAEAYLLKGTRREEVFRAIRVVHGGGSLIEPLVASTLFREVRAAPDSLTPRESEVLQLVARGASNKRIARDLSVSERTVKFHVSSLLAKLNAPNRTAASSIARERGLILT